MKMNFSNKNIICTILLVGIGISTLFSQTTESEPIQQSTHEPCGFNHRHQEKLQSDPLYLQRTDDLNEYLRNFTPTKVSSTSYRIPVVVHVMSDGTSLTEITDAQIYSAIEALNERYRKVPGSVGDGNGVDVEIEFALAIRDENGNCTNGIVRYDLTWNATYVANGVFDDSFGISETDLKSYSVWDQTEYYNIWLVSEFDNNNGGAGLQGYAYFSGAHGASYDGTMILAGNFASASSTTLAHELGHSLSVYHTFNDDNDGASCPPNADCSADGDLVCDTPPHIRSSSDCVVGTNACDGGSSTELFIHNYMDYSSDACQSEFTAGQKVRMITALTGNRASFLEVNGNMALVPPTTAGIEILASSASVCTGNDVQFYDYSSCSPNTYLDTTFFTGITYSWTFDNNSGTILTSTLQNPLITFNTAGVYDVTLEITNGNGTTTLTEQGLVIVTTSATAASCNATSSYGGTLQYGIFRVILNTLDHSSSGTYGDNLSGLTVNGYGDFTCTESTVLQPNTSYDFSIEGLPYDPGNGEDFKVYIDYNDDGDFVDTGEEVLSWDNAPAPTGLLTQSFTTDASPVLNTLLRLRVISARDSETITPCMTTSRGQIHDFGVYFSNDVASVSIAAAPSTTISYGTSVTFTATPTNGGAAPSYEWYVNGVLQSGEVTNTFNSSTLVDGDVVYCIMTSNLPGVINSPATSNELTMNVTGPPLSEFSGDPLYLCEGSSVTFTDESILSPTSWTWNFAGGTPLTSSSQNPTILYATAGVYNVDLTASNGFGTGTTETKTNYITVLSSPASICESFSRSATADFDIGIHNVTLNTINNSTAFDGPVFNDYSCSQITLLETNTLYPISVQAGPWNNQWVRVYIDYNNDGDFNDAGELVFSPTNGMGVLSGTFTTPASPNTDELLRMRVISDFTNTSPGACTSTLQYGQVEDYGVVFASVCNAPVVTLDPVSETICDNESIAFNILATGTGLSYQWEVSTNGGGLWSSISDNTTYSGTGSSTLDITNATTSMDSYMYRCIVSNICGSETSGESTLTVNGIPSAPVVTVVDNCGSSDLSTAGSNLVWSTAETTNSITVVSAGPYTVTQTVNSCTSSPGTGIANPLSANSGSESITECDSYTWSANSTTYNSSGTYMATLTNVDGCDSVATLNLTITNSNSGSESINACDSYTWSANGTTYNSSGTYMATLTNVDGCDSIATLNLIINNSNSGSESITACDSYTWSANGTTYNSSGSFMTTLTNVDGCDSIATLNLTINNSNSGSESVAVCDSYTWSANGTTYNSSGSYMATLTNVDGCDSIATLNLTINNSNSGSESITACDSYMWSANGTTYNSSGTYMATLTNVDGCDSIATLNLTIGSANSGSESITSCDSYTWSANGTTYNVSGTYMTTLTNVDGCDSIATLNLTINNSNSGSESVTACDSYTWSANGTTYNVSGSYMTTLTNVDGCDSIATLNLTINNSNSGSESITACDSYTWSANGTTYNSSGTYMTTLTNVEGCDSIATLNLTIGTANSGSESISACNSYTWSANGTTYNSSGTYMATLTNVDGCDSIATLNLTIGTSVSGSESITACDSYTWSANGTTYNSSGTYMATLTNVDGCDSIATLNLTIGTANSGSESITACDSYIWSANGTTYNSSGTYMTTLTNVDGCDSIATLNLTINNSNSGSESVTSCDSYIWSANGTTYNSSGTYMTTLTNVDGCDSIATLNLTIGTANSGSESFTACDSYTWSANGTTYNTSGSYMATLTNLDGCDSIATLNLTINNSNSGSESITICDSYTWSANGTTYNSSGAYMATLTNVDGCDSIATLNLTINNSNSGSESVTACDSYTWSTNGATYNSSGTYMTTLTNIDGCDSIATLNLTIGTANSGSESITGCDSYTWSANGTTYNSSGTYMTTLTNIDGCDSIATLNLTIGTANSGSESVTACDSYIWSANGATYNSSGSYMATLTNVDGCDSIATLNLTINNSNSGSESITTCDSYNWSANGTTYNSSGTYMATLTNVDGCDSIATLNLTINNSNSGSESITACDSYTWSANGTSYNSSGTYMTTLTNVNGCDSIATLNLTIGTANSGSESITECDSYTWSANGMTYTSSGTYTETLTNTTGCDSIATLNLTINMSSTGSLTVEECDNYFWSTSGLIYNTSGTYTATLTNSQGCDSVITLNLTINDSPNVTFSSVDTVCLDDAIIDLTGFVSPAGGTFNGAGIVGNDFDPSLAGVGSWPISYTVVDGNSCTDNAQVSIVVDGCIGINEISKLDIDIFPNPTIGTISIESSELIEQIEIVDYLGRIVLDESFENGIQNKQLEMSKYSQGVYHIRIRSGNSIHVEQIVYNK